LIRRPLHSIHPITPTHPYTQAWRTAPQIAPVRAAEAKAHGDACATLLLEEEGSLTHNNEFRSVGTTRSALWQPTIYTYIHTYIHYIHIYIDNCQVRGVSLGPIKISNLHAIAVRVVEKNLENIRP
jgi:hypothetical protein